MPRAYEASDYAGIESKHLKAYYGYEETMIDEWCFVAWVDGREVMRIPRSKLGLMDGTGGDDCADYLLNGLAILFDKAKVSA